MLFYIKRIEVDDDGLGVKIHYTDKNGQPQIVEGGLCSLMEPVVKEDSMFARVHVELYREHGDKLK